MKKIANWTLPRAHRGSYFLKLRNADTNYEQR